MIIAKYHKWTVSDLELTPEKLLFIWEKFNHTKALFSDLTLGDVAVFRDVLLSRDTLWFEVKDDADQLVGLMYLTNTQWVIDAEVHIVFFDRKLAEKAPLCLETIQWVFRNFPFRRLTAVIPSIYFVTIRLAKKIGFKEEGIKRESQLIGNKWVDETILGILRSEAI